MLFLCTLAAAGLYAVQALAPHYTVVVLARSLLGAAIAGILPTLYALLAAHAPESFRSSVMGVGSSAMLLGNLLGPLAGSAVAGLWGMRWVFATAAVLMAALSVLNPQARLLARQLVWLSSQRR